MKQLEKLVAQATAPSTNVAWLDIRDNSLKIFMNGEWVSYGGGGGGGLIEEGTPGNLPVIGEDGISLVNGLVSQTEVQQVIDFLAGLDEETLERLQDATLLKYYLNILIGYDEFPTFDEETPFSKGSICLKDGKMYRFTNPHLGIWSDEDIIVTNFYKEFVRYYSGESEIEAVSVQLNFDMDRPSMEGKTITVTYSGTAHEIALSNTGAATFTMSKGINYTIEFPAFDGYNTVVSKSFTSFLESRSVEVTYYHIGVVITDENVTIKTTFTNSSTTFPQGNVSVYDQTADTTTTYALNDSGICVFSIAIGHKYTVTMPSNNGYITPIAKEFTAALNNRYIVSKYAPLVSGMMIMTDDLLPYTYDEWVAAGLPGTDAKYIYCSSETLQSKGAAFFFNIDDIRNNYANASKYWLSPANTVDGMPVNGGTADYGVIPYSESNPNSGPKSNIGYIQSYIDNQAAEGITYSSTMLQYIATKNLEINGQSYPAYVGTTGQWAYLENKTTGNYGTLNRIMQMLHATDSRVPADLVWTTKTFWTSTQYSSASAWCLYNGSLSYGSGFKASSLIVLPFYAL